MRRRYLSTDAGRDKAVMRVACQCADAIAFYFLCIPAAGDDCELPATDPDELLWEVWPARRDLDGADVQRYLRLLVDAHLLERTARGTYRLPPASFYKYQTYIPAKKRDAVLCAASINKHRESAQNAEEHRISAQNAVSPSPSPSPSPSITTPNGVVAPDADAPDAEPAKTRAARPVPKQKQHAPGISLTPLADAFIAVGLAFPGAESVAEVAAAQRLLRHATPEEIASCWQDVVTGDYGDLFDQKKLSFCHLAGARFLENWRGRHNGTYQPPKRPAAAERPSKFSRAMKALDEGLDAIYRNGTPRSDRPTRRQLPGQLSG